MIEILGIFPWIFIFLLQKTIQSRLFLNLKFSFFLYLSAAILINFDIVDETYAFSLIFLYLFSIYIIFFKGYKSLIVVSFIWYIILIALYLYQIKNSAILVPIALLTTVLRPYKNFYDFLLWIFITVVNTIIYFVSSTDVFLFFLSDYVFYFMYLLALEYIQEAEREKLEYKNFVDRALNTEVQKKLRQLDENVSISSKKLKEIFKLSNYAISTTDINAMSERVVDGLLRLGYTGAMIYIEPRNIFKKVGFFPDYNSIYENFKKKKTSKVQINERKKYILIPLKVSDEILGFIAVYKNEGVSTKEVEYLITYANSVSTAVANIIHFEELLKLEELTYQTFESLDIGIAVLDKNLIIKMANKRFQSMLYKNTGTSIESIPEFQYLSKDLKSVFENKKVFETTLSSIDKKGSVYRIKALPLRNNLPDKPSSSSDEIVILIEDVTEKDKLETQIIQAEKLAVIGKMAATLAHEIRNPLTAISASAYRIKTKIKIPDIEGILSLVEKIETHTYRAQDIINKILNYSKLSYRDLEIVNLKTILNQTLEFISHSLKGKNIRIKANLDKDVFVYGDKNALQQAFINIIMNAIEELENLKEKEGIIKISLDKDSKYALVKIQDNGRGIPEDISDKIFEPFFTTKERGTGLGLSIVSRIIKDHKGEISVKRENGTTFIVKLPLAE